MENSLIVIKLEPAGGLAGTGAAFKPAKAPESGAEPVAGGHRDRLQRGHDLGAARFEPRRQQQARAQFLELFVGREADVGGGEFAENAARRAAVRPLPWSPLR